LWVLIGCFYSHFPFGVDRWIIAILVTIMGTKKGPKSKDNGQRVRQKYTVE